jgi:hypothetical protein
MSCAFCGLAATLIILAPAAAHADFHIVSPYEIDLGELEIEHNGSAVFDRRPEQRDATSYTAEFGTGLTSWWHSEIELGFDRAPGDAQPTLLTQAVWENMFQLTEPGERFVDVGFYFEYGQSLTRGPAAASNQITFGPVLAKEIGRTVHTINLFFTRELGPDQTTQGLDFSYRWQSRWNIWTPLSPAIEIYGDTGVLGQVPKLSQQQLLVGPVGVGALGLDSLGLGHAGKLKYEIGWLFGATPASPRGALRWRLEVEIPF